MHRIQNLFHIYNIIWSVTHFPCSFSSLLFFLTLYGIQRKHLASHFRSSNILLLYGMNILQMVCFDHFVHHFESEIEKLHLKFEGNTIWYWWFLFVVHFTFNMDAFNFNSLKWYSFGTKLTKRMDAHGNNNNNQTAFVAILINIHFRSHTISLSLSFSLFYVGSMKEISV